MAQEWKTALENGAYKLPADLARGLNLSRARVTQVLRLLKLSPEVLLQVHALGDPLPTRIVSERILRPILDLPEEQQRREMEAILSAPAAHALFKNAPVGIARV